ncbi:FAD:protein FMN transferase [Roseococcus sp. SDR]|uniref:FAD:protein FMN transferase n=1 Tax=Roseococcus sp. SDR TaxID=2835532 RepID=UPI001BCE62CE|nr:FAD:protein FMN transferase [Roseococcus sp. SDR]MBS7792673.1 FAD:protein FMN transferase [Roseococcus sp. SDR]MBV1847987.1 FAD:protein FMN transferase [Roseococcus sp. SDR]
MKTSTDSPLVRHALNGPTMGTRYAAIFHAPEHLATAALAQALSDAVDRVDQQMSSWKPDSDLNRLNAAPVGAWVTLPPELMTVLAEGLRIGRASGGAFDMGVGGLVAAWGFGPGAGKAEPGRIAAASAATRPSTMQALQLDPASSRARKTEALCLDLSGIAKGFGVDEMARVMDGFGIPAWLVGIDGEMRARGTKPDGTPWAVAHERPDRHSREAMGVIELSDMAVATSGSYRHWAEVEGRIVSHTMDPARRAPLENDLASVSVLAPSCMAADAWATAFMVLGAAAAAPLAERHGLGTIFVRSDGSVQARI